MSGSYTTNVPAPVFGATGFIPPAETAILAGVQADISAAFGGGLNPALETPQGQLASSETAIIGDCNDQFLLLANACDPAYAVGRFQDAIARIYFIERNPAQSTVLQVACLGLGGTLIPADALVQDTAGYTYACVLGGTIPASGSVTLAFANTAAGPLAVPATNQVAVYRAVVGWDTATCLSGVLGNVVESRADFEYRRQQSVALNAQGSLPSVKAAVLAVPGVLDCYVTQNVTSAAVTVGGQVLAPHSLYVAAAGGDPIAIASAIWTKQALGCDYNGNTTVMVQDAAGYSPPYPSYPVTFEVPAAAPVYFAVTIANSPQVPATALSDIQGAIMAAFAGADGGARARIGGTIYASRFYAAIAGLGAWAQIVEVLIGITPSPASFSLLVQINQVPTIAAGQITLALA